MTTHSTIVPPKLQPGDTVAFVSPSERLNHLWASPLSRAALWLESLGLKVKTFYAPSSDTEETFATAITNRVNELHAAFSDPSIKAIVCTVGGTKANQILRHLDYALISANPKILVGNSDITNLHYALYTQAHLRTFYGPAAISELSDFPTPISFTAEHFTNVLLSPSDIAVGKLPRSTHWAPKLFHEACPDERTDRPRDLESSPPWTWVRPGAARGPILGGCLPIVVRLAGTPYFPSHRGSILLLETPMAESSLTRPLPIARARAAMVDLLNAGVLEDAVGLVVGRPFGYDADMREAFRTMIGEVCDQVKSRVGEFPILCDVDVGHTSPVLTVPLGALAELDSGKDEWKVVEAGVS
ncbi:peptidase S66, LD-carboxypeptidase A [Mytilinidion resinicola]|uniref:Peptidase S66, LD-carboxypeptidase A n=1 Tax=Mytilinidion resinicola TaxID=574789 RepID=A0A6A6Y1B4_9PEZI|nr:peptidase S66, LD-carboxypeptidase A [Mytilinidion resinicola]KAF2802606.1 peptidase S66, LD-carboxypeptidase A [Mytilinidion resinicola]